MYNLGKTIIMKRITDIQELRKIQIGVLDELHRFCSENALTYFLSSGSLIGAVRHGGYIPWDDDIDVYMPRGDYERLLNSYCDKSGRFKLLDPRKEKHYFYTFAKLADTRTLMKEEETKGYEIGVYVDVFPVDYVSDDLSERERVFRRKKLLYKIRRCKLSKENCLYSQLAYLCYKYLPIPLSVIDRQIEKQIVRHKPTGTVCNMTEAGPAVSHCFPASAIASSTEIGFEGKMYMTMIGYKTYLECTYGDYMKLPPVEQRQTHKFEAWWR